MQTYWNQRKSERGSRVCRGLGIQLLVFVLLNFSSPASLSAAVFHVPGGNVPGLIAAINAANSNGEENTIILEAGIYTLLAVDNTIMLPNAPGPESNGLPVISSVLTIQGAGAELTSIARDANAPSFRIMFVAAAGTLTLDGLTIRGGKPTNGRGGGVSNEGTVSITDSTITENGALAVSQGGGGSLFNARTMTIIGSSISGDSFGAGGGVQNQGTMTITNSFVFGRSSPFGGGGGISNRAGASLVITTSSISGNVVDGSGGGVSNSGTLVITNSKISGLADGGGGIINSGTLTLTNSTVTQSVNAGFVGGGAGMYISGGQVTISNSTIADNQGHRVGPGGILIQSGSVTLQNTILARNIGGLDEFSELPDDCTGTLISLGNNLIGDPTGCTITLQPSDRTGDAGLGVFVDPGTPGAERVPLLVGSPAIDPGNDAACPPTDQLGTPRNGTCDIGAVEFYPVVNDLVALGNLTRAFDPTPVPDGPAGTFRISAEFINTSNQAIVNPFVEVVELTGENLLLNADGGAGGVGARLTLPDSATTPFQPGASSPLEFLIGLQNQEPFTFFVNMLGEPQTPSPFVSRR